MNSKMTINDYVTHARSHLSVCEAICGLGFKVENVLVFSHPDHPGIVFDFTTADSSLIHWTAKTNSARKKSQETTDWILVQFGKPAEGNP